MRNWLKLLWLHLDLRSSPKIKEKWLSWLSKLCYKLLIWKEEMLISILLRLRVKLEDHSKILISSTESWSIKIWVTLKCPKKSLIARSAFWPVPSNPPSPRLNTTYTSTPLRTTRNSTPKNNNISLIKSPESRIPEPPLLCANGDLTMKLTISCYKITYQPSDGLEELISNFLPWQLDPESSQDFKKLPLKN